MKTLTDSLIVRLSKRLEIAERKIEKLDRAMVRTNIVPCACCGEYYGSKDNQTLGTTKGPICLTCIRDEESALEDCKVDTLGIRRVFWEHYNKFLTAASVDGKRYVSGSPIDPSKGLRERDSRDLAIVLWDFAEVEGLKLLSHGGFAPTYNPSDFRPDGGVWIYHTKA